MCTNASFVGMECQTFRANKRNIYNHSESTEECHNLEVEFITKTFSMELLISGESAEQAIGSSYFSYVQFKLVMEK